MDCATSAPSKRAVLLTCYMTGADEGMNLGNPGYSYDFVAKLFWPLLERWGKVIPVPQPQGNLDKAVRDARNQGYQPIHVSFLPFQDVHLATSAPNVVVPAWEFPDIPDCAFDGNPKNDWRHMANQCDSILVGGEFTKRTFLAGGVHTPIHIVSVPTPTEYFETPSWDSQDPGRLPCKAYIPRPGVANTESAAPGKVRPRWQEAGRSVESFVRGMSSSIIGRDRLKSITSPFERRWRDFLTTRRKAVRRTFTLPYQSAEALDLRGIVYTSIFNPTDGRKNWIDLLTAFQTALADCEDATLLVKLVTSRPQEAMKVIRFYLEREIPHRCRVLFLCDYLRCAQMAQLARVSTYYLQATRAEGNCLPLMNFLAAGRPGVSPRHSAIEDYFNFDLGFVVESHPEPAAWPHERQLRIRTAWGRLVWPSLVEQIRVSYELAKDAPAEYAALSDRCRAKMASWAHESVVWKQLETALAATTARSVPGTQHALRRAA